mmetsp:Transcript_6081/g.10321  ORF Transcript_6081/g.10321 Transcript_6081/m.10321 type:complete len:363 (+) Transcript_6081:642-1730(+)
MIQLAQLKKKTSLSAENLLLRGCILRNTEHVYGAVVYQGHDTKIMKNSANARYKLSKLEGQTTTSIISIFGVQVVMALIGAYLGTDWLVSNRESVNYLGDLLGDNKESFSTMLINQCGTWILIFTNFVPISLMVTLELVKFWQGMFMSSDYLMYDEEQDMPIRAQSSNLNEELGQVEYVFSDKTGTLTCNIMEFRKFTAGAKLYGTDQNPSPDDVQESNVRFHDPQLKLDLLDPKAPNHEALVRVLVFLSCCHTIIIDQKKGTYNAASPDELALVNAAKQFGFEFKGFDKNDNMVVENRNTGESLKYQLLHVCEFNSTRKRMSVILKDPQGRTVLMCKGADSVILERLNQKSLDSQVLKKTQ